MKRGERKITESQIREAINGGSANANIIKANLEKQGITVTYVTVRKRAEELEKQGKLMGMSFRTAKGSHKKFWRLQSGN